MPSANWDTTQSNGDKTVSINGNDVSVKDIASLKKALFDQAVADSLGKFKVLVDDEEVKKADLKYEDIEDGEDIKVVPHDEAAK